MNMVRSFGSLLFCIGAIMSAQKAVAEGPAGKKWEVELKITSLEAILLNPEKILKDPDDFWKTDDAYILSNQWHQNNRIPLDDKDYYNKWLAKLKAYADVPEDRRQDNQAFRILNDLRTRLPIFEDKSIDLLNGLVPRNKLKYSTTIHITTGTYAFDFMTGGQIVTDVLSSYFGNDPDKIMNLLTHECYHIAYGYNRYLRREAELDNGLIYNTMLDALHNEGLATYVGYLAQGFFPAKGMPDYQMLEDTAEVRRQIGEINRLFGIAENTPIDSLRKNAWETGVTKRGYYVVGAHMARTIDEKLGRDALLETVVMGPLSFIDIYNSLVENELKVATFAKPDKNTLLAELKTAAFEDNKKAFARAADKIRTDKEARVPATEARLIKLGYGMVYMEDYNMAIDVFKLNTELFPGSANAYDCLAEAYLKSGDKKKAIRYYEQALKADPKFSNAEKMLKELRR